MRSSEHTKEKIIKASSTLFNTKGYKTTSLSDITTATGYTKGAIYRHFENKDVLEIEAFESMIKTVFILLKTKIKAAKNSKQKLFIFLTHFENYITEKNTSGGCPLLNLAIEVDDTNFDLKKKAQNALSIFKDSINTIIQNGKKYNEIKPTVNEDLVASVIIASLEGGIMMSKLKNSDCDIKNVIAHLKSWIENDILI